jgi:hypothetical protein
MPSPTSPTVDQTESVTFAYGALAHGFLFVVAVALFLGSHTLTHVLPLAYVCAHCTLSVTMGLRSSRKWRSSLLVTVLGVCAHTTLFVYGCCASSFAWMPALFILAQALMAVHYVYNYLHTHRVAHTHDASGRMQQSHPVVFNTPDVVNYFQLLAFVILTWYYFRNALFGKLDVSNKSNDYRFGLLMVGVMYALFTRHTLGVLWLQHNDTGSVK